MVKNPNRKAKEVEKISTYQEFMVIIGIAMLIITILDYARKK